MYLKNLYLANFKNYEEADIDFSKDINALVGDNGSGKTNLLDAIYFLSMTKSAFNHSDVQCIRHGADFYSIIGRFVIDGKTHTVGNALPQGKRKKITIDENPVEKAMEIIGRYPVVMVAPNHQNLITEGGETRRKFFDSILSQLDRNYLADLLRYNHALKQRNSLLRQFAESGRTDRDMLESYDRILLPTGKRLCNERMQFSKSFLKKIIRHYRYLTDGKESIDLEYQSSFLADDFESVFHQSMEKDLILQRTNAGIHRDDYIFSMDGFPLKKFGSQGQQKSFIIALKLAHFDVIHEKKGIKPILLLDDVFDKLDDHRIGKLTNMIEDHEFGQVFITDARPERTTHFLEKLTLEKKVFYINNGTLSRKN